MRYVTAILLAAGRGVRFRSKIPKPLVKVNSLPVIVYSLKALSKCPEIKEIIVVVNRQNQKAILSLVRRYRILKIKNIVLGGLRRQDSVACGLKFIDADADLVLIHDAARPFIQRQTISRAINEARKFGAAIVGVPVKNTVKKIKHKFFVEKTIDRKNLWEIQTPQVFHKDLIQEAYRRFGRTPVTDDAALVEKLGVKPRIVLGSYFNMKITSPEDLVIAEAIAKEEYAL